jgi:ribosomal protein L44E
MNGNYNYCNNFFLHRVEKNKLLDAIATRRNSRNHQRRRASLGDTTNNDSAVQGMKESGGAHGVMFFTFLPRSN